MSSVPLPTPDDSDAGGQDGGLRISLPYERKRARAAGKRSYGSPSRNGLHPGERATRAVPRPTVSTSPRGKVVREHSD
jgi:hypothetical protein